MGIPRAIVDGVGYHCSGWKVEPGERLVTSWQDGWAGGMGETRRRSSNRYLFGEKVDSASAGYLRLHPEILATIEDADLDATLPLYCLEGEASALSVTFDAATTATETGVTYFQWNATVANNGARILLVAVKALGTTAAAVWCGGALRFTKRHTISLPGGVGEVSLWCLVAPPIGTNIITVMFNGTATSCVGASESWYNVSQTTPFGTVTGASGTSTAPSVTVASAVGQVVVDFMAAAGNVTATVGAGQTQRYNAIQGTVLRAAGSSEAGAASVVMSWTLSSSVAWATIGVSLVPASLSVIYALNGRYGYKLNGSSYALLGTKDYGAGAQCGRPELFESAHYIPLGASVDAQKLTAFGAGDPTTDTSAPITGIKAHAFCAVQDASTAKLARALNNKVDISPDGADWSGDDFEAGDSTFNITDLLSAPGELIVIRPDGPRRFNVSGESFEIVGFYPKSAAADATLGSNSHGHGPYSYWVDISGIWRILGENAVPMGPEADPDFSKVAINEMDFPLEAGNWRSVTAIGRWLYATHYQTAGGINGDLLYGYIGSDGLVERWHGSLFDSDRPLRVTRIASGPALVIVEGKPGDQNSPAIHIMALDTDGSPRTRLDGNRGKTPAAGETIEHFAIMAPWDAERPDREKQLARVGFITEGMATGSSWQIKLWRDASAQGTLGAPATTDGTKEVKPATPGTDDTFYRLFVAPYCTVGDTFVSGDPRLRGLTIEARMAALITAEINVSRKDPGANIDFETALAKLRALAGGPRIPLVAPERSNPINGHVVGVAEQQVGDPDTNSFGYRFTLYVETFDADAGAG